MAAATEPEVRTRLGSDEIASLAVGSDEIDGWEKVLTAHSSRDQGISLGLGDEEEEEDDRGAMVGDDGASEERLRESQGGEIERAREKEEGKDTCIKDQVLPILFEGLIRR